MPTAHGYTYIVEIEGIAGSSGQARYCTRLPDYSDANYNVGLAEAPRGSGSGWNPLDGKSTSGRFTLRFRPDTGPLNWLQTEIAAETVTAEPIDTTETAWDIAHLTADIGSIGTRYCDRETLNYTSATPPSVMNMTRGYAGSTAVTHEEGAAIFTAPPTLIGRKVTVSRVAHDAAGAGSEVVIQVGYISGEPKDKVTSIEIDCQEWWPGWEVNTDPQDWLAEYHADGIIRIVPFTLTIDGAIYPTPLYHTTGDYWYIPEQKVVFKAAYTAGAAGAEWIFDMVPVWSGGTVELDVGHYYSCYQVTYSEVELPYAIFGRTPNVGAFEETSNPIDILLNVMTSIDGTNVTGGDWGWDLGSKLYPHASLAIPIANIDIESFRQAREELDHVQARRFWLGGNRKETLQSIIKRLIGIWGYSLILQRDGTWTIARLQDVYPDASVTALTNAKVIGVGRISQSVISRPTDKVTIELSDGPEKKKKDILFVQEVTKRTYYPYWIGGEISVSDVPYLLSDFDADSTRYNFLATQLARTSGRIPKLTSVRVGDSVLDSIEAGGKVTIHDLGIRDPATGDRLTASDSALNGIVGNVRNIDHETRTGELTVYLTGSANVARIAPSAVITGWHPAPNNFVNVTEHEYSLDTDTEGDGEKFVAGDKCILLDSHGAPLSDTTGTHQWPVVSSTATTITFTAAPEDAGGNPLVPAAGNIIVYDYYDNVQASQIGTYAYAADDAPSDQSYLGTADVAPYVYGD